MLIAACAVGSARPSLAAGSLNWTDVPGDATGVDPLPPPGDGLVTSTPRPQDEGLDLLAATAASDGQTIVFTARTAKDAMPAGATGATLRFLFSYEGAGYQFIAQRTAPDFSAAFTTALFLRARQATSSELTCKECTVKYDPKNSSVTIRAQIASLAVGIKEHSPKSKKFAPGAKLTDFIVLSQRNLALAARNVDLARTLTVDMAPAKGMTLVV